MRAFDASSIIYGWDNYPIKQFPSLWNWMATEVGAGNVGICTVALIEVDHKIPECGAWLRDNGIQVLPADGPCLHQALAIKGHLGITNDQYAVNGVDENDILIIAACRVSGIGLVSDENRQPTLPANRKRY